MISSELPEHRCDRCDSRLPRTAAFTRQRFTYEGGEFDGATGLALFVECPFCRSESVILWSAQL